MINYFFEELKKNNIIAYICGGKAFNYHFDKNNSTYDTDIHIFLNFDQINNKYTFEYIYNCIKKLHCNLKKNDKNILPLKKFDYSKLNQKYIPKNLLGKIDSYYNYSIICDIQISNYLDTVFDISVIFSSEIDFIKKNITENFIISKDLYIKQQKKFLNDLSNFNNKFLSKRLKISNRLDYINSIIKE